MTAFWILIVIANAFTLVGIVTQEMAAFAGTFLFVAAAVVTLLLGGVA